MSFDIVKSGARALEVMEFFADCRRASVMQAARALGYPQSSTSELLKSLTAIGYLRYDARLRTYSAGSRAALLGARLSQRVLGVADIGGLLECVAAATAREAHLCEVAGGRTHYLAASARAGARRPAPLLQSAAGLLFLATMADADAARAAPGGAPHDLADLLARVRRDGYARRADAGWEELAAPLGRSPALALSLSGPRFGDDEHAAACARQLRATISQWRNPAQQATRR